MKNDAGKSLAVIEAQFADSAPTSGSTASSATRPRWHGQAPAQAQPLGPVSFDVCMDCHEDEITPFQGSVHAKVKGGKPATCQGCHGSVHTVVAQQRPERADVGR